MKKLILAAAAVAVCVAIGALIGAAHEEPVPGDCNRTYVFRDEGGFVACFELGESEPFLVTDIEVKDLTPLDRVMLRSGVEVYGARAMSRTLEDYCS